MVCIPSIARARRQLPMLVFALLASTATAAAPLTPEQASAHVGENATVCGTVASASFATRTKGSPTFLNLGRAYPNQIFTVVIWGSDREKFGAAERRFAGKRICVTGPITLYRGKAEIIASDPGQITEP